MSQDRPGTPERRRIQLLSDALIDQIAAGEVVERPASVVKELLENAVDADARRVRVEVRAGGRDWIAVTDDGVGMSPEDARLALQRHATSKIAVSEDLERIHTFGFRGEALPAIASVSRLRLRTRACGASEATELQVEVGAFAGQRSTGAPEGTRVEVADLFAGVPARRKFLKSAATEWGHVHDWVARTALALPALHFDLRRDDRAALSWPAVEDPLERIAAVLGEDEAAALVPVGREEGRVALRGFASRPDRHRATTGGIYLYVNGRPVRDRVLQHALIDVYRDWLPRGRFPSAVLFLTLPGQAVDVNVHPAKWEVRFADARSVHELVRRCVRDAVAERRWIGPAPGAPGAPRHTDVRPGTHFPAAPGTVTGPGDWIFAPEGRATDAPASLQPSFDGAAPLRFGDLRLLGQLLATYLVLEGKDRLLLIDQHAAHERVLYERLRREWIERGVERQGLLVPSPVALDPRQLAGLEAGADTVERLGFELEPFGDGTVVVRATPALLADRDPAELVRGLADELAGGEVTGEGAAPGPRALDAADRVFAGLACHSARRKGEVLEEREQRALLDALDSIPWAPTCPHGRPVAVPFDQAEIERRFGRR